MKARLWLLSIGAMFAVCLGVVSADAAGYTDHIPRGSVWKYYDQEPCAVASNWAASVFDDSGWTNGPSPLGFSTKEPPEHVFATTIGYGGDPNNVHPAAFYRHSFVLSDMSEIVVARIELRRDDAAIVHINGSSVYTNNMNVLPWACDEYDALRGSDDEQTWFQVFINPSVLVVGTNVVAVEIHQQKADSSDSIFDFGFQTAPAVLADVVRGPYLQVGTPHSMIVRWRTDVATNSRVRYGDAPTALTHVVDVAGLRTEHVVSLTNLVPAARYYYAIGAVSGDFAGADTNHFFQTAPIPGSPKRSRIWAIGDSGTSEEYDQGDLTGGIRGWVRSYDLYYEYLSYTADRYTDVWLLLGDNAYQHGTDHQHQVSFFNKYPELLRQTVVWPSPGNHEYYNGGTDAATETGPYFDIFTMPRSAEAGGVASGSEAYYSFDYANVHFISLDSMGINRNSGATAWLNTNTAMYAWLELDLAETLQEWIVMFWHHPPYTKGSHNSDAEGDLIQIRENFLPLLESYGVDLVLCGHSHNYERSMLLKGHYDVSSTFTNTMAMDDGDGRIDGDGAYSRAAATGTVYAVVGSSGKIGLFNNALDHPVMVTSMWEHGSMIIDVADKQLDAIFLDDEGNTKDWFTLLHDQPQTDDSDEDGLPDWWEKWHFGSVTNETGSGDADEDTVTNESEYKGGTDPGDPASLLEISSVIMPASNSVTLGWQAVPGQLYDVLACTNLLDDPLTWNATVHTNQKVPVSGVLEVSETVSNGVERFYRLSASPEVPW